MKMKIQFPDGTVFENKSSFKACLAAGEKLVEGSGRIDLLINDATWIEVDLDDENAEEAAEVLLGIYHESLGYDQAAWESSGRP